ncbi:MAG: S9 family peptidase [Chitinophagaceae bacterium]
MKKIIFLLLSFNILIASAQKNNKRNLNPSDFYRYQDVENPQVSPDGNWVAYELTSVDTSKDKTNTDIWMVNWNGTQNVQLTNTKDDETTPRFSPDGKYLSFLSDRKMGDEDEKDDDDNDVSQLWLLDRRGGEAKKVTDVKGDIEDYAWRPDGKKVLLVMKDEDFSDTSKTKIRSPYVINRYHFKEDIYGYLENRKTHLYLLDITTQNIDTLTSGNYDETSPAWRSPDGLQIAFVSNRSSEPDKNENTDIFIMNAKPGAKPKQLTTWQGVDDNPVWSPDGKNIAYLQSSSKENFTMYGENILAVISKDGGEPKLISQSIDRPVSNPRWSKDGQSIIVLMEDDRQQIVAQFNIANTAMTRLAEGERVFSNIELNKSNGNWLTEMSNPQTPSELYVLENGNVRRLTHVQDSFLAPLKPITVEGFKSTSKDGNIVSGILYRPSEISSKKKLPLILYIHGGPVGQDDYSYDLYRNILAAGGYAVAAVNYRGSSGRGVDYTRAIFADWGNKEVTDIIGAADYLIQQGIADSTRMGIAGWSYGGILTDYTIASTTRFKAAASGAGSALQLSMYGVDEYVTQYETELGAPWKNMDKWIKLSYPFFHADRIKTPTLFMASQKDFNVPSSGAEQMYQALRSLGVPTELIIYPGQFHEITVPGYLKDRFERYLQWFNKYLK